MKLKLSLGLRPLGLFVLLFPHNKMTKKVLFHYLLFFTDVFVTTDIHNTACIPPSAKRPTPSSTATSVSASTVLQMTSGASGPVPFSPMDQIEELDVFCGGYSNSTVTATSAASTASTEVDSLEKALGIEFHDPNVHRQLLAK